MGLRPSNYTVRIAKRLRWWVVRLAAALVVAAVVLYLFGLRFVQGGSGMPHLAFVKSADRLANEIERNRAEQRAAAGTVTSAARPTPSVDAPTPPPDRRAPSALSPVPSALSPGPSALGLGPLSWSGFRGPDRDGVYRETPVIDAWPAVGLKPLWKEPVGLGYASFAIGRGRAFTIEQRRNEEVVAAYDVATGRELWTNRWTGAFRELMGGDGPRATPTWADGLVYAAGALGELRCLDDETGRVVWRVNILDDNGADNTQWGVSASPLVVDGTVIVFPGGPGGRSIVAYDRRTGKRVWSAQDDRAAYVSPMLVTLGGVRQLLVISANRLMGLTPDRGDLLWDYPWTTQYDINAAQPVVIGEKRVFISSSYGTGAAVVELQPRNDGKFDVREVWRNVRMKNKFASSVLLDGYIYGLDENILACLDANTGELKWKGGRYGYGQVILAGGNLIVLTEEGDLALVRAMPDRHQETARFAAIEGKTWNVPTIAGGILLVRNLQEMAAFDLRKR